MTEAGRLILAITDGTPDERFVAAETLERLSRQDSSALEPQRSELLKLTLESTQAGVQWHLAEMVPRLAWSLDDANQLVATFERWIAESESRVVKADALSAISYLAHQHDDFMPIAKRQLARALRFGSAAEQARARKLIDRVSDAET